VLALSTVLVNGYGPGHAPSLLEYGVFCGAGAFLFAAVGLAAIFFEPLQGIIVLGVDGVASFFLLAGAAAFAAEVKTGDCTSQEYLSGSLWKVIRTSPDKSYNDDQAVLADATARCRMVQADTAFIWILFICFLGTVALAFFSKSSRRGGAIV